MCLATVYLEKDNQRQRVMEDVAWITPADRSIQLVTLLGESREFRCRIKTVDLVHGTIVLEDDQG